MTNATTDVLKFVRHMQINRQWLLKGNWFLLETSPFPPSNELELIISDIYNNKEVFFSHEDGVIRHYCDCQVTNHGLSDFILNSIDNMKKNTYRIAIWEGDSRKAEDNKELLFQGQPICFILEPDITFSKFPDHPHLNAYPNMPDSICYTDNINELGELMHERVYNAIKYVCIWLIRHELWVSTKDLGNALWIGPHEPRIIENGINLYYNPFNPCYCGSGYSYKKCCLLDDYNKTIALWNKFNVPLQYRFPLDKYDFVLRKHVEVQQKWTNYLKSLFK